MRAAQNLWIPTLCFAWITACPVDDRRLRGLDLVIRGGTAGEAGGGQAGDGDGGENHPGTGGSEPQGGTGAGPGGSNGAGLGGSAGMMGGGAEGGQPPTRCPDLDGNEILDCDETILDNGTFDQNTERWTSETGIATSWSAEDARDNAGSGCLIVENQIEFEDDRLSMFGTRQCVDISGGEVYQFGVEIAVDEDEQNARGLMQILLFDAPGCAGNLVDRKESSQIQGSVWKVALLNYLTPSTAKSVAIRLVALKPNSDPPSAVRYDNVLVRPY